MAYRREFIKQMGLKDSDQRQDLRICSHHGVKTLTNYSVKWCDKANNKHLKKITMIVPSGINRKSSLNDTNTTTPSRGTALDRRILRHVEEVKEKASEKDNLCYEFLFLQAIECQSVESGPIHPAVRQAAGIRPKEKIGKDKKRVYGIIDSEFPQNKKVEENTVIQIDKVSKHATKSNTGFTSTCSLVCFIIILCDGNLDLLQQRSTTLTWFEEWFFFFERLYGRTMNRWCDSMARYQKSERCLRKVFYNKLKIIIQCRQKWPRYLTLSEDLALRGVRWESSYGTKRVIFWDNTNVRLSKPADAEAQRNTYSAYYAGNVAKGAVFIQPCGWMGTHDLWMGAVSDSDYFTKSGILEQQQIFINMYDNYYKDAKWVNVLDKGYRVVEAAWRVGKQFVLQPTFAKSDKKFTTYETVRSSAVASDRGGNERAVRLAKTSSYLQNGTKQNQSIETLCDVWLVWGFLCNFIYKPVYR